MSSNTFSGGFYPFIGGHQIRATSFPLFASDSRPNRFTTNDSRPAIARRRFVGTTNDANDSASNNMWRYTGKRDSKLRKGFCQRRDSRGSSRIMAADRHFGTRHGTLTHRLKDEARRRSPPRLSHRTRTCQLKSPAPSLTVRHWLFANRARSLTNSYASTRLPSES